MRNADMPAMPQSHEYRRHLETYLMEDETVGAPRPEGTGLTKREHFAALAITRIEVRADDMGDFEKRIAPMVAKIARIQADALLEELEKTK